MSADSNKYCIPDAGVSEIDAQHAEIMKRLQRFRHLNENSTIQDASKELESLIAYVEGHFKFEEMMIGASNYEFSNTHQQIHTLFMDRLKSYKTAHINGRSRANEVYNFIRAWFVQHMTTDDLNYVLERRAEIETLLADKTESGWYSRTMYQCFSPGENCVIDKQ